MRLRYFLLMALVLVLALPALAQSATVTDDDVNDVASKLYCPVCENIPLDTCGTAACQDWRYEIRLQLENGQNEQQIIDDFITRFGERVVGTPQDPLLRALSLATPWLIVLAAAIGVFYSLIKLRNPATPTVATQDDDQDDAYRQLLEQDLSG